MADTHSQSATVVTDPVCGMTVDPATAKQRLEHAGKSYYFCGASCAQKFKADPEKFLTNSRSANPSLAPGAPANPPTAIASRTDYVCPMCAEVREHKPGPCPKCGMALEPEMPTIAVRAEYTCPMHPQIVRPGPGFCPICGMALEPRNVTSHEEENPELRDMTYRFWISLILTVPLLALAMADMWPGMPV